MINLEQRLNLLFSDEAQVKELLTFTPIALRNQVSRLLKTSLAESSALGLDGQSEADFHIPTLARELGIGISFDLLQIDTPIVARLTMYPQQDHCVKLVMGLWITDRKPTYTAEYHVVDLVVDSVHPTSCYKRIERMFNDLPVIAASAIANV